MTVTATPPLASNKRNPFCSIPTAGRRGALESLIVDRLPPLCFNGLIGGVEEAVDDVAVFESLAWHLACRDAVDEVAQLLAIPVCPGFVDWGEDHRNEI